MRRTNIIIKSVNIETKVAAKNCWLLKIEFTENVVELFTLMSLNKWCRGKGVIRIRFLKNYQKDFLLFNKNWLNLFRMLRSKIWYHRDLLHHVLIECKKKIVDNLTTQKAFIQIKITRISIDFLTAQKNSLNKNATEKSFKKKFNKSQLSKFDFTVTKKKSDLQYFLHVISFI